MVLEDHLDQEGHFVRGSQGLHTTLEVPVVLLALLLRVVLEVQTVPEDPEDQLDLLLRKFPGVPVVLENLCYLQDQVILLVLKHLEDPVVREVLQDQ